MEYTCPMHPEIVSKKPGSCPKCGMKLVVENELEKPFGYKEYSPLVIVIGVILLTSLVVAFPGFELKTIVSTFMAGFFIVFAGFKLIDLRGFASGYSTYDLLAMKWSGYSYIYPFIELFFGLSMILGLWVSQILIAEIFIMSFSGIGVLLKILKKERFQCVCLGTFLKVPLTKVTLIEDFGMALLGVILLFLGR